MLQRFPLPGQVLRSELLFVCLFYIQQTAAVYCGISECLGDSFCCDGQCCSQSRIYLDNSWYGPLFISMLVAFFFICLCGLCNCLCKSSTPAPTENLQEGLPPLPAMDPRIPTIIITLPQQHPEQPPPYNEVTSKPFLYPAPIGQPPSYNSVVAEDPLSREIHVQLAL
ncbi:transmembrane protein 92 isoform X2 [Microcaecilia unicolor]|uniref:Transmembrane protein 92 isoform X2 n=1 Tax=Microcaecilia unicolor TaxID=1415580 RepID=A0A6P7ZVM2_9AMPH|nr:transmembrane protein 92 isoform X2 [Microcaecilia unicolor]